MKCKFNMEYPIVILQDESRRKSLDDENKQALDEAIAQNLKGLGYGG